MDDKPTICRSSRCLIQGGEGYTPVLIEIEITAGFGTDEPDDFDVSVFVQDGDPQADIGSRDMVLVDGSHLEAFVDSMIKARDMVRAARAEWKGMQG